MVFGRKSKEQYLSSATADSGNKHPKDPPPPIEQVGSSTAVYSNPEKEQIVDQLKVHAFKDNRKLLCESRFTWEIHNWKSVSRKMKFNEYLTSPPVSMGGYDWYLKLYPAGEAKGFEDYCALYLTCKSTSLGWRVNIDYGFVMWNPENPLVNRHLQIEKRTLKYGLDTWGFKDFVHRNELTTAKYPNDEPLVHNNDTVNVTLYVRMFEPYE